MSFDSFNGIIFFCFVVFLYFFVRNSKRKHANYPSEMPPPSYAAGKVTQPEFNLESVLEMAKQIYGRGYRYNDEIQKALNYPNLMSKEEHSSILNVADRLCKYAGRLTGDKAFDKHGKPYMTECENFRMILHLKITKAILNTKSKFL